jgi:hypothetical protein
LHNLPHNKSDWFKVRKYPHFGLPIEDKNEKWVREYVSNPKSVLAHSFYPFLHRLKKQRKFRKVRDANGFYTGEHIVSTKDRNIHYAAHLDANVFAYYASLLNKAYEEEIVKIGIEKYPTAYRRIEKPNGKGNCSNVDFAEEVFSFIRNKKENGFLAIIFDITSFFDELDHKILKKSWRDLLGASTLPDDHFKIFKQVTKYTYCREKEVFDEFKNEIVIKTKSGEIKRKAVKKFGFLKRERAISFCAAAEFRSRIVAKNRILKNRQPKGIPQGSPISSILANIYLMKFDEEVSKTCTACSALYRRYSDDIVVVCNEGDKEIIKSKIMETIASLELRIQKEKTKEYEFIQAEGKLKCFRIFGDVKNPNFKFDYLGFEFDGESSFIKSASVSNFYRKMKRALRRASFYSQTTAVIENRGKVFRGRLYKRFSHIGMERRIKYVRDYFNPSKFHKTKFYDWGNFLSYVLRAARTMDYSRVRSQVRGHWKLLNHKIIEIEKRHRNNNPK